MCGNIKLSKGEASKNGIVHFVENKEKKYFVSVSKLNYNCKKILMEKFGLEILKPLLGIHDKNGK